VFKSLGASIVLVAVSQRGTGVTRPTASASIGQKQTRSVVNGASLTWVVLLKSILPQFGLQSEVV
jgi:hypothetical protein